MPRITLVNKSFENNSTPASFSASICIIKFCSFEKTFAYPIFINVSQKVSLCIYKTMFCDTSFWETDAIVFDKVSKQFHNLTIPPFTYDF